eukprot:1145297-Amphidinium_carterae.1
MSTLQIVPQVLPPSLPAVPVHTGGSISAMPSSRASTPQAMCYAQAPLALPARPSVAPVQVSEVMRPSVAAPVDPRASFARVSMAPPMVMQEQLPRSCLSNSPEVKATRPRAATFAADNALETVRVIPSRMSYTDAARASMMNTGPCQHVAELSGDAASHLHRASQAYSELVNVNDARCSIAPEQTWLAPM